MSDPSTPQQSAAAESAKAKEQAEQETDEVLAATAADDLLSVSPEDEITAAEEEVAKAAVDIADAVVIERDQYKELAQRLQAEFENFRKRSMKQQSDATERANEALVVKLLPVLDTIDLALAHEPNGSLEQVRSALLGLLTREGLERIDAAEKPFDPEVHEAVAHEPSEGGPVVSEDLRAGYRWKGRVIRPSMVKVTGA
jgi:molecular chaperone GrpE